MNESIHTNLKVLESRSLLKQPKFKACEVTAYIIIKAGKYKFLHANCFKNFLNRIRKVYKLLINKQFHD